MLPTARRRSISIDEIRTLAPFRRQEVAALTIEYRDGYRAEALLGLAGGVGRLKTQHEDPGHIVEAHEVDAGQRGRTGSLDIEDYSRQRSEIQHVFLE